MDKIKITRKEIDDMYDIEDDVSAISNDDISSKDQEEVTIEETVDQFTERKDEEKLKEWRSE